MVAVTGIDTSGAPVGMTVGSFTSVSLDPPLVGFFPARTSVTWLRIASSGAFAVNLLGHHQQDLSRRLATAGADRFGELTWTPAGSGSPVLEGVLGWIDCDIESIQPAGDHYAVLGRVRDLAVTSTHPPLVFHRGAYQSLAG